MTRRFLRGDERTGRYERAVAALRSLLLEEGLGPVERAFAEAVSEHRLEVYVKRRGIRLSKGRCAIERLAGKRAPDWPLYKPFMDHYSLWLKDGRPYIFTAQPYHLNAQDLQDILDVAGVLGLDVTVRADTSWWFPGATVMIEFKPKD